MKKIYFILTALFLSCLSVAATSATERQYATLDWTVAETLIALGEKPVAIGDVAGYQKWVVEPQLPTTILDLGIRHQPNLEQLAWLAYQTKGQSLYFINTSFYAGSQSTLSQFGTVKNVDFYAPGNAWQNVKNATYEVAKLIDRPESAVTLLQEFSQKLTALRQQATPFIQRPIALVQFIDTRHLRIYGENSLFGEVLRQLGFQNAWNGTHNHWGFETITIAQLAQLPSESRFVVVKPYPSNIAQAMTHNTLWQHLPLSQNTLILPAIWTFGGVPSALRFAEVFVASLQHGGEAW
ncbi:iron-siderophore ABC transporter substrate-binding protein [Conservatibacter flavescens]|uniref:Iron ABC transporter substrate-binding protein n=1 Tax=Conservatibacter flavescens TaxID=28161 RepID=A0A2M8S2X8_9PAST|nr:iron-siderophore ABC transporter substrate-binding protein [Conservatibacter flavescens]PJG85495.1 iron ABC transporter substrate-binding protein [Conservatibacter flavescens]